MYPNKEINLNNQKIINSKNLVLKKNINLKKNLKKNNLKGGRPIKKRKKIKDKL
jgi:hypothetical protein